MAYNFQGQAANGPVMQGEHQTQNNTTVQGGAGGNATGGSAKTKIEFKPNIIVQIPNANASPAEMPRARRDSELLHQALDKKKEKKEEERIEYVLKQLRLFFRERRDIGDKSQNYAVYNEYLQKVNENAELIHHKQHQMHFLFIDNKQLEHDAAIAAISEMLADLKRQASIITAKKPAASPSAVEQELRDRIKELESQNAAVVNNVKPVIAAESNLEQPKAVTPTLTFSANAKPNSNSAVKPETKVVAEQKTTVETATLKPINPKELQEFLNHVAWGRQDEAEAMLKVNKDLALAAGDATDHAKRTFKNITGLQYAVWALDWKMWTMLLRYLPQDAAKTQARGFKEGAWVKEHAEHATWKNVTDAQQVYVDKYSSWDYKQCKAYLTDTLSVAQCQLPIHVLQEYNNPDRPFEPCPNFGSEYTLERSLPEWLTKGLATGKFDWGLFRYNFSGDARSWCGGVRGPAGRAVSVGQVGWTDRRALISLYDTRVQQRGELVAKLLGNKLSNIHKA